MEVTVCLVEVMIAFKNAWLICSNLTPTASYISSVMAVIVINNGLSESMCIRNFVQSLQQHDKIVCVFCRWLISSKSICGSLWYSLYSRLVICFASTSSVSNTVVSICWITSPLNGYFMVTWRTVFGLLCRLILFELLCSLVGLKVSGMWIGIIRTYVRWCLVMGKFLLLCFIVVKSWSKV